MSSMIKQVGEIVRISVIAAAMFAGQSVLMAQPFPGKSQVEMADTVDSDGLVRLAGLYVEGNGVGKDIRKAWKLYGKAASMGNTEAQYRIGCLYRDAVGTKQDMTEAAYWFRKAASNGHPEALVNIGRQFELGVGVLQDNRIAAENYRRAGERGNAEGAFRYAGMLRDGIGVDRNVSKARIWFQKAADMDYPGASEQLRELSESGKEISGGKRSVASSRHRKARR